MCCDMPQDLSHSYRRWPQKFPRLGRSVPLGNRAWWEKIGGDWVMIGGGWGIDWCTILGDGEGVLYTELVVKHTFCI